MSSTFALKTAYLFPQILEHLTLENVVVSVFSFGFERQKVENLELRMF